MSFIDEEVDVCVIGSGAGGAPVAYALAQAGAKVVLLEKGPWYTKKDFDHDEIRMVRRNFFVPYLADEPRLLSRDGQQPQRSATGWVSCCVGGGTVHMSGFSYRLHPEDFTLASRYPELEGASLQNWPITYAELAPYYDMVERVVGVSGVAGQNPFEPPRSGPYPFPALAYHPLAALVDNGAKKLGLHPFETPRAIVSQPMGERSACVYCDFCSGYGCEVDAKSSTAVALIPQAIATGRCELRTQTMAFEIKSDGKRARSVRYFDEKGASFEQRARVIVVAASAIESAPLLLNSGVANRSGLIGKNLSFSTQALGYGEFERKSLDPALLPKHATHFLQRSLQDYYFLPELKGGYDKGGTINFQLPHKNAISGAERIAARGKGWGKEWKEALYRFHHDVQEIEFEIWNEFLPNPNTFVTVSSSVRDRMGLPVAHLHVQMHDKDRAASERLVRYGHELLGAAGATQNGTELTAGIAWPLQHGTCRFGNDPKTSVLDKNCEAHDVKGLFVTDGSFMPTSGGVPPTMTIMANAFRVADHLIKTRKSG
jgi:choline dehydrogenase-like flavoprotein